MRNACGMIAHSLRKTMMINRDRRVAITVPNTLMPMRDADEKIEDVCACKKRPINLCEERGIFHWFVAVGDQIEKGDTVGEGEVGKRTVEIIAPVDGIFDEQCIEEMEVFEAGTVLGYITPV